MLSTDHKAFKEFQRAPQASRHDFFTKFSTYFDPSDWAHLHSLLTTRSYYIDFLTALPIELSLKILGYLPRTQTILLRTVSREYNSLLTSSETCRFLTCHFFPLSTPAGSYRDYENLVSRHLFFQHGQPNVFNRFDDTAQGHLVSAFCATGSVLASLAKSNYLQVHQLVTSPLTRLLQPSVLPSRVRPQLVAVTPLIVVAAPDTGSAQVWNLSTREKHMVHIPSLCSAVHAAGYMVAMVIREDLLVHDAAAKTTKYFKGVLPGLVRGNKSLIVHEPSRRVWVVHLIRGSSHVTTTTVVALCLDTGRVAVPARVFRAPNMQMNLADAGNGIWMLGCWHAMRGYATVAQIRIDVARTDGDVQLLEYPLIWLKSRRPVMVTDKMAYWCQYGAVSTWGETSWAGPIRGLRVVWDGYSGLAREVSLKVLSASARQFLGDQWTIHAICDQFLVVANRENMDGELAILRFKGVHEEVGE